MVISFAIQHNIEIKRICRHDPFVADSSQQLGNRMYVEQSNSEPSVRETVRGQKSEAKLKKQQPLQNSYWFTKKTTIRTEQSNLPAMSALPIQVVQRLY